MLNNWINKLIIIGFFSVACGMPAMAQEQQNTMDSKTNYSNEELKSFIMANVGIYQVQQQISTKMPSMETEEQKQELVQAANQQMEKVLQNHGMTADEYNEMGKTIQSDVQLQEKINTMASELFQLEEQQQ